MIIMLPMLRFGIVVGKITNSKDEEKKILGRVIADILWMLICYSVLYYAGLFKLLFSIV